ncbi:MAG: MBL fold metallo-hydrolase, partial [Ignavibacteriales bacterium]|nr:MBL fold metallo-hydrolase [Ignavibacteriales bacterium]
MNISEPKLKLKRFVFNPFMENTYVIWDTSSMEAIIVDPGNSIPEEDDTLLSFIAAERLRIKYLVNTHGHLDHILGNAIILANFSVEHYIPKNDLFLLQNADNQCAVFGIEFRQYPLKVKFLDDLDELQFGSLTSKLIYTPGHTPGEFCLYFKEQNLLISGDVLFLESIGRTDLKGGNSEQLLNSIREKLLTLPPETIVLPGHGEDTTIDNELKNNPF